MIFQSSIVFSNGQIFVSFAVCHLDIGDLSDHLWSKERHSLMRLLDACTNLTHLHLDLEVRQFSTIKYPRMIGQWIFKTIEEPERVHKHFVSRKLESTIRRCGFRRICKLPRLQILVIDLWGRMASDQSRKGRPWHRYEK